MSNGNSDRLTPFNANPLLFWIGFIVVLFLNLPRLQPEGVAGLAGAIVGAFLGYSLLAFIVLKIWRAISPSGSGGAAGEDAAVETKDSVDQTVEQHPIRDACRACGSELSGVAFQCDHCDEVYCAEHRDVGDHDCDTAGGGEGADYQTVSVG